MLQSLTAPGGLSPFARRMPAYGILVAVALNGALFDGFFGDGAGYLGTTTLYFFNHPLALFIESANVLDSGHPLLLCRVTAALWNLFGFQPWCAHLLVWICASAALAAMHESVRLVFPAAALTQTGFFFPVLGALLLFAHPHFIGQVSQYHTGIPSLAFTLGYVLACARRHPGAMLFWGLLLVTNRITDILPVFACFLFDLGSAFMDRGTDSGRVRAAWVCGRVHLVLAALFLGHYALKSLMGLPITNSAPNTGFSLYPGTVAHSLMTIFNAIFAAPRAALFPLFSAGCASMALVFWLRLRGEQSAGGMGARARRIMARHPRAARFYGLGFAVTVVTIVFYSVMTLNENARFYLHLYPFLILAGMHGIALALRYRRWWIILPAVLWMGLQVFRWEPSRLRPLKPRFPFVFSALFDARLETSLEVRRHIQIIRVMAGEVSELDGNPILIGTPPTIRMLSEPHLGYVRSPRTVYDARFIEDEKELAALLGKIRKTHPGAGILAPIGVWDAAAWRFKYSVLSQPRVQLLITHRLDGASILLLYNLREPVPATPG